MGNGGRSSKISHAFKPIVFFRHCDLPFNDLTQKNSSAQNYRVIQQVLNGIKYLTTYNLAWLLSQPNLNLTWHGLIMVLIWFKNSLKMSQKWYKTCLSTLYIQWLHLLTSHILSEEPWDLYASSYSNFSTAKTRASHQELWWHHSSIRPRKIDLKAKVTLIENHWMID